MTMRYTKSTPLPLPLQCQQWLNLRHLGEPLGGDEGLLEAVSFKKAMESMGRISHGSEFHPAGAATLKPREANVVQTQGTDNRLVFAECRERVGVWLLRRVSRVSLG